MNEVYDEELKELIIFTASILEAGGKIVMRSMVNEVSDATGKVVTNIPDIAISVLRNCLELENIQTQERRLPIYVLKR